MNAETMFTLGRRYALSGHDEQDRIMKETMSRMTHWSRKKGNDATVLFACFVEGTRSAERDFTEAF